MLMLTVHRKGSADGVSTLAGRASTMMAYEAWSTVRVGNAGGGGCGQFCLLTSTRNSRMEPDLRCSMVQSLLSFSP